MAAPVPNARGDRLYDLAQVFRSKNAGPLHITFDMIFPDPGTFERVVASGVLTAGMVAGLYEVPEGEVRIIPFAAANAIKITIPRKGPTSGAPGDHDVYGAQQHIMLCDITVP